MLDEEPIIRKATFIVKPGLQYTFDVNETTRIADLKKVLILAAHLIKKTFRIFGYQDDKDYTDMDEQKLSVLFPEQEEVIFKLFIDEELKGLGASSMELPDNEFCSLHKYKYKNLYCFDCKESLCLECIKENKSHQNHYVMEKCDYLTNSQILAERLFLDAKELQRDYSNIAASEEVHKYYQTLIQLQKFQKLKDDINCKTQSGKKRVTSAVTSSTRLS